MARRYQVHHSPCSPQEPRARGGGEYPERPRRFPLALLFLERFLVLCRSGGWVAIILPLGVAANARWHHVRRWLLERMTIWLVLSLPRQTFAHSRTTTHTCLLLMSKDAPLANHEATLAVLDECPAPAWARLLAALASGASPHDLPPGLMPPPLARC